MTPRTTLLERDCWTGATGSSSPGAAPVAPVEQFEPVRRARAMWERTQPQMFFEVDDISASGATVQAPGAPFRASGETRARSTTSPLAEHNPKGVHA